jgi:tRNA(fMet)-specific endonuclease VapC
MAYLIDSDWVIDHLANVPEATELLEGLAEEGIAISVVTYMEVFQGLLRSPSVQEEAEPRFGAFVEGVPVVPLSLAVARRCARIRQTLRRQRKRVNTRALDLIIAAAALEHDLTLVTRNLEDYDDIPELRLYLPS